MSGRLNGKVALVTGGSSGIGLAAAIRFVAEGATVYVTGRKQDALDKAVRSTGGKITAVRADSGVVADLHKLYATIRQKSGKLGSSGACFSSDKNSNMMSERSSAGRIDSNERATA